MIRKKNKRTKGDEVKLEMTPMIDVVFQLLIFFVVSVKQEDILSSIMAMRPEADARGTPSPVEPTTIVIDERGFRFRDRSVTEMELANSIERASKYGTDKAIIIKCTPYSSHNNLMKALDICARHGMRNIAIFTM